MSVLLLIYTAVVSVKLKTARLLRKLGLVCDDSHETEAGDRQSKLNTTLCVAAPG